MFTVYNEHLQTGGHFIVTGHIKVTLTPYHEGQYVE
jgi:hypothetical protein